jgi:hypothetical protein
MHTSINNFFYLLPKKMQEEDKVQHMVWSFGLLLGALVFMPPLQAFVAVWLVGLAKEFWDLRYGSGFCLYDMVGNLIGCLGGLALGGAALALSRS